MAVLKRKPAKPIPYPPRVPKPRAEHVYAEGGRWKRGTPESWTTIATFYSIPDVWDLILYNFGCRNPREVNWCMETHLGCSKSSDGKNYSFSPTDTNPKIMIPPVGFKAIAPEDTQARALVLSVLQRSELSDIKFRIGKLDVNPSLYRDVVKHIESNTILCAGNATLIDSGVLGRWFGLENVMFVRNPSARTIGKEATVVHEATHAGFDVRKKECSTLEGESCGYLAEAMFTALVNGIPTSFDPFAATVTLDNVRRWALALALEGLKYRVEHGGGTFVVNPANTKLAQLRSHIKTSPHHRDEWEKPHPDDGV